MKSAIVGRVMLLLSHPFTPRESKGSLTFSVPGAKEAVSDTIRLLANGEEIRKVGVVF